METARCRAFLAAAESGSLTRAAERLGYTPSGVSQLVGALEKELGLSLLVRGRKGVTLSPDGARLLPVVRELLGQENRLREMAAELTGLAVGSICVGAYSSILAQWMPPLLKGFRERYPGIEIQMKEGPRQVLLRWMEERQVDVAFLSRPKSTAWEWIPLQENPLLAILPRCHPLAQAEAYRLDQYDGEPFIVPGGQEIPDTLGEDWRRKLRAFYTVSDNGAILSMVEQGIGISILNELSLRNWTCDVAAVPLSPPRSMPLGLAVPSLQDASPTVRHFVRYAIRYLTQSASE